MKTTAIFRPSMRQPIRPSENSIAVRISPIFMWNWRGFFANIAKMRRI